jgi:hypothetical protein
VRALHIGIAIASLAAPVAADEVRRERLAAILEASSPYGLLDVEFAGCYMVMKRQAPNDCADNRSWRDSLEVTDLRIISPRQPQIGVERDGRSQIRYDVFWPHSTILRNQARLFSELQDKGYALFPTDVEARLRWFEEQGALISDPSIFAFASKTTNFCSGATLTGPNHDFGAVFYIPMQDKAEFINLFAKELVAGCDATESL